MTPVTTTSSRTRWDVIAKRVTSERVDRLLRELVAAAGGNRCGTCAGYVAGVCSVERHGDSGAALEVFTPTALACASWQPRQPGGSR